MDSLLPLFEIGHRSIGRAKSRLLSGRSPVVVFEHLGVLSGDHLPRLLAAAEDHMKAADEPTGVRKRLLYVLVEAMDNLGRHGLELMGDATFALLVRDQDGYRLATGNVVPCATGLVLSERVAVLNMMGREDLKAHYLKMLAGTGRSGKGGAGLGLLTLARKSTSPIMMSCERLGPFTSYFTLEVRVGMHDEMTQGAA